MWRVLACGENIAIRLQVLALLRTSVHAAATDAVGRTQVGGMPRSSAKAGVNSTSIRPAHVTSVQSCGRGARHHDREIRREAGKARLPGSCSCGSRLPRYSPWARAARTGCSCGCSRAETDTIDASIDQHLTARSACRERPRYAARRPRKRVMRKRPWGSDPSYAGREVLLVAALSGTGPRLPQARSGSLRSAGVASLRSRQPPGTSLSPSPTLRAGSPKPSTKRPPGPWLPRPAA